jgi:hypothetical protein
LPAFGQVVWDGENQEVITSVHFELNRQEPIEVVNLRAWKFFNELTPYDIVTYRIEVDVRSHRAVRATLKPRGSPVRVPGATARLRQLAAQLDSER